MALVSVGCKRTRDGISVSPPFPILQLPNDLIYHIAFLTRKEDHIWLATTCKRLYKLFLSCPSLRGGRDRIYTGPRSFASSVPRFRHVMREKGRIMVEHPDDPITKLAVFPLAWDLVISTGNIPVLMHLRSMNIRVFDKWSFYRAAEHGRVYVLRYMASIEKNWDTFTCRAAAVRGRLNTLRWLRKNKCPWDEWTPAGAARGGHLRILQWARDQGCPWDRRTCLYAAVYGHLNVLQWAREHGCKWDKARILARRLTPEVRVWVQAQP
jgi:hypothetical protein